MSTILDQAPPEVHEMAGEILRAHHPELRLGQGIAGPEYVRLCILFATAKDKDDDEPAVKCHGYPAAAVISVIPYKQRVDKRADAEIVIDAEVWDGLTEPQQRALLDHEITHLEVQTEEEHGIKVIKTDDQGRPKLKLRLHDWQLGGFRSIADRYGADALEVLEVRKFQAQHGDAVLEPDREDIELLSHATGR